MKLKTLSDINFKDKRVLLETGFDVPIKDGVIIDERRIRAGLPTIEYLIDHGAVLVTIIFKIGRPPGHFDSQLSTQPVKILLEKLVSNPTKIIVKENLRFDPREDADEKSLAKELVSHQDIFVQDAFSVLHRSEASDIEIPKLLPTVAGLLVEKEVTTLAKLLDNPPRPYVVVIGGVKLETKVPLINNFSRLCDWVLVGGKIANQALAEGIYKNNPKIILPVDGVKDDSGEIRDIGPKTIDLFKQKLAVAKTIFWNGDLGKVEDSRFRTGSVEISQFLAKLSATKIAGGGDTSALLDSLGIANQFDFISTAGGASLVFLAGQKLPGLEPLISTVTS